MKRLSGARFIILMDRCQVFSEVANIEGGIIAFIALYSDPSNPVSGLIVNFQICSGGGDVLTRLTLVSQSKVNIIHVNF